MTTDINLDALTRELTAYASFEDLVNNRDRDDGYRPTMRADLDPRYTVLADAYDAAQAARGSRLRAFRDGQSITPAKERMVADIIAKWREELEEAAEKGRRDDERMLNGWLFGIEIAMSMIGMSDLALMACRAQKAGKKEAA